MHRLYSNWFDSYLFVRPIFFEVRARSRTLAWSFVCDLVAYWFCFSCENYKQLIQTAYTTVCDNQCGNESECDQQCLNKDVTWVTNEKERHKHVRYALEIKSMKKWVFTGNNEESNPQVHISRWHREDNAMSVNCIKQSLDLKDYQFAVISLSLFSHRFAICT